MSKTFLRIESHLIDIYTIKHIELSKDWNFGAEQFDYNILINNPKNIKVDTFTASFKFSFDTERERDTVYQELIDKLEEQQVKII